METFIKYWERTHNEKVPSPEIPGDWFAKRRLPIIVSCACCDMTMALPNAMVGSDEYLYCSTCAEDVD